MNLFVKEILVSTIGVMIGVVTSWVCLTILLYLLEMLIVVEDKTAFGWVWILYLLIIPIGGFLGNKYAVKWFVE